MNGLRVLSWVVVLAAVAQGQGADRVQGRTPSEWVRLLKVRHGMLVPASEALDEGDADDAVSELTAVCARTPARVEAFRRSLAKDAEQDVAWTLLGRIAGNAFQAEADSLAALKALRRPELITAAAEALDGSRRSRDGACRVLTAAGPAARAATPALVRALADEAWSGRFQAAWALGAVGGPGAVKALARALADDDHLLANAAARGLGDLGPAAVEAVPDLIQALTEERAPPPQVPGVLDLGPGLRAQAALALGRVGEAAAEAVPDLIEAIGSKDEHLPRCAAFALGQLGAKAESALPALQKLAARSRNKSTQAVAEQAIRSIQDAGR